jgi:hypothetical protein
MKNLFVIFFGLMAVLGLASISLGEEKVVIPQEQNAIISAVAEAPAAMTVEAMPAVADVQSVISSYIKEQSDEMGDYDIYDPQTQETRELSLVKILDQVGKTGDNYFACGEFTDKNSNEKLDLDFDIENIGGKLSVVDVKIHKINDVTRFTYDEKGNRMAVETPEDEAGEVAPNSAIAPAPQAPVAVGK